jgi:hypothetical protein
VAAPTAGTPTKETVPTAPATTDPGTSISSSAVEPQNAGAQQPTG